MWFFSFICSFWAFPPALWLYPFSLFLFWLLICMAPSWFRLLLLLFSFPSFSFDIDISSLNFPLCRLLPYLHIKTFPFSWAPASDFHHQVYNHPLDTSGASTRMACLESSSCFPFRPVPPLEVCISQNDTFIFWSPALELSNQTIQLKKWADDLNRLFSKDTQMTNRHLKRFSASL